jgi:hypothetical protein
VRRIRLKRAGVGAQRLIVAAQTRPTRRRASARDRRVELLTRHCARWFKGRCGRYVAGHVLGIGEDRLSIYLNDHLMGSTTGVRIARDLARRGPSPVFDELAREIAEDRQSLLDLIERFGAREDHIKVALGWVVERASQLKFTEPLRGYTPLSMLEELETLSLGVEGKLAMWEALRRTHAGDPRLGPIDLDALIERASSQRARLEHERMSAAEAALG